MTTSIFIQTTEELRRFGTQSCCMKYLILHTVIWFSVTSFRTCLDCPIADFITATTHFTTDLHCQFCRAPPAIKRPLVGAQYILNIALAQLWRKNTRLISPIKHEISKLGSGENIIKWNTAPVWQNITKGGQHWFQIAQPCLLGAAAIYWSISRVPTDKKSYSHQYWLCRYFLHFKWLYPYLCEVFHAI